MEKLYYDGIVEPWKVELIVARAWRMGFRRDELPDVQQQLILEVVGFKYDPARSNGAKESTALQSVVDNHLKKMCRTTARYRARVDRLRDTPPPEAVFENHERTVDVRSAVAALSEREREVCRALSEGYSKQEIAKLLRCGWHTVDRLMRRIRAAFEELGLDGYLAV